MTKERKDTHELIHNRSVAGCIHQGWVLLAEHPWDFIRGGALILLLATITGIGLGLALPWIGSPLVIGLICLVDCILTLMWIIQVAGLVQKFHQQGFFPSLRPLFKPKRKDNRVTALAFWKSDWKQAVRTTLRLFVLMVKRARHWGNLLGILIVGGIVSFGLTLVASLPLCVLFSAYTSSHFGELMGDTVTMPALMPLYASLAGVVALVTSFLFALFLLLPLAYFGGSLTKEERDKAQAKQLEEARHE